MLTMEDIDLNSHHLLLIFYHRCPVEELHEVSISSRWCSGGGGMSHQTFTISQMMRGMPENGRAATPRGFSFTLFTMTK
jgi:hypothetical protein